MTDLDGKKANLRIIERPHQPSDLDVEGERFGQALLADQGFIQAISSVVLSGLSTGTPNCYSRRKAAGQCAVWPRCDCKAWWERPMTPPLPS